MSFEIPTSFVEQFSSQVHLLAEQRTARLQPVVTREEVTGESFARERIGTTQDTANQINTRHGDTPLNDTPHSRRWGFPKDYDVADLIDNPDRLKLLIDPQGPYVQKHAGVMGRTWDDEVINASLGTAVTGNSAGGTQALPSGQKLTSNSGNALSVQKLINAKELLDANEVPEMNRFFITNAKGMSQLLADEKATSADFASVRALTRGEINDFMGFTFIRSERVPIASGTRSDVALVQGGVIMGVAQDITATANQRPDKRNAQQIYTWSSWGAVRIEDEMVVEVQSTE